MGETETFGNMEKEPVQTDAFNVAKDDVSHKPSHQDDEPKPDYSSKATNKTQFTHYLRIFTYSTWSDRILLVRTLPQTLSPYTSLAYYICFSIPYLEKDVWIRHRRRRHLHLQVRPHGRTDRPHRGSDRSGAARGGVTRTSGSRLLRLS